MTSSKSNSTLDMESMKRLLGTQPLLDFYRMWTASGASTKEKAVYGVAALHAYYPFGTWRHGGGQRFAPDRRDR